MATEAKLAKARSFIVCLLLMMGMVYDVYLSMLKILDRSAIVFSWKIDASLWGAGSKLTVVFIGPIMSVSSRQLTASDME